MSNHKRSAAVMLACLIAAAPALGQTSPGGSKVDPQTAVKPQGVTQSQSNSVVDPSTGARKQNTQGLPPNMWPQDGGSNATQSQGQASKRQ
jgi:hypothetical protein